MRPLARLLFGILVPLAAAPAQAHGLGGHPPPLPGWSFEPLVVAPLLTALVLYGIGWGKLQRRSAHSARTMRSQALWFAGGWSALALALVSPLHEGGERSFTLHMIEHELIMLVAAPAVALAHPLPALLWAWPGPARRWLGRAVRSRPVAATWTVLAAPTAATGLQAAALWLWHMPVLFDLALARPAWHIAQHLALLLSALLFWTAVLPRPDTASGARALSALCLFATSLVSGGLGALMALSTSPWYAAYARLGLAPLGLTPVEDQQFAGLIMWVPGGLVHAGAALALTGTLLRGQPRETCSAV